ncbi:MAG: trigger factor [bacterium]|nr:trigger factor [bacterium]
MKNDVQKISACRANVTVEATAEEIDPIFKSVRASFTKQVKLPGFRPGKAPWAAIEKQYGDAIKEETAKQVTRKLMDAVQEAKLKVATVVTIEDYKAEPGAGASAKIVLDLEPEFDLPEVSTWNVKKMETEISDDEVTAKIAEVRQMMSTFAEATADDVASEEDILAIDFTSDLNPEGLSDAAKRYVSDTNYWTQIREDAFIPGLKAALTGKKLGETVEFASTFPEDYAIPEVAGKTVNYKVTLSTLRKLKPATDEELVSRHEVKSMDELRDMAKKFLGDTKKAQEAARVKAEINNAIAAWATFELPERILDERIYDVLATDNTKPLETFKNDHEGLLKSDVYANAKKQATDRLHVTYTLEKLADAREVKLSNEEFEGALDRLASHVGMDKKKLVQRLLDNGRMNDFLSQERSDKMLSLLVDECAVL